MERAVVNVIITRSQREQRAERVGAYGVWSPTERRIGKPESWDRQADVVDQKNLEGRQG